MNDRFIILSPEVIGPDKKLGAFIFEWWYDEEWRRYHFGDYHLTLLQFEEWCIKVELYE